MPTRHVEVWYVFTFFSCDRVTESTPDLPSEKANIGKTNIIYQKRLIKTLFHQNDLFCSAELDPLAEKKEQGHEIVNMKVQKEN